MIHTLNDFRSERYDRLVVGANVVNALVSAVFGVIALLDPDGNPGIDGGVTPTATYYAAMYGVRALPIAVAVVWLALTDRHEGWPRLVPVLVLAGSVQLCDAVIGTANGTAVQAVGGAAAAVVHLGSAWLLRRRAPHKHNAQGVRT